MTAACSLPSHGQSCPGFDAGLDQAGLAEVVAQSVSACDPVLQPLLYSNILLTGPSVRWSPPLLTTIPSS